MVLKRQTVLGAGVVLLMASARGLLAADAGMSAWVHPGNDGKLVYQTTERGDRVMDFSYSGYMGAGVAIPDIAVQQTVKPLRGAGESQDDSANIQAAIDAISKLPLKDGSRGAVLLAPGVYHCSQPITISASGVVLRGSGTSGAQASTLLLNGKPHVAITVRTADEGGRRGRGRGSAAVPATQNTAAEGTRITDAYVPSGANHFTVEDAGGLAAGDWISIRRPVTAEWVKFMHMDDMTRDGKPQTWIRAGNDTVALRRVTAVAGNVVTVEVPLSDSFDAKYLGPNGARVVKAAAPALLSQVGVEHLHIQSPPQEQNHTVPHFQALRLNGEDCWARDIVCDETMNSVGVGGRRITLERISVVRKVPHLGASKPAEFAPNGTQVLMDRCSVSADNVWFAATGAGVSGPMVLLNCTFRGSGKAESHQRWSTGLLYDNVRAPEGGLEMRNRGSMGSGHGWGMGWGVMWNCEAKDYIVQDPPGAMNWMIGCIGESQLSPRPFGSGPLLPRGTEDSAGAHVRPQSLYLAQLKERLGAGALKNMGYSADGEIEEKDRPVEAPPGVHADVDRKLGEDLALHRPVGASNVRGNKAEYFGDKALDGDDKTCWATDEGVTSATLELDMEGAVAVNAVEIAEAAGVQGAGHVQAYKVEGQVNSDWKLLSQGTTIAPHQVDHFPTVTVWKVRLTVMKADGSVAIRKLGLYDEKAK